MNEAAPPRRTAACATPPTPCCPRRQHRPRLPGPGWGRPWSFRLGSRIAQRETELVAHDLRVDLVRRVLHPTGGPPGGSGQLSTVAIQDTQRVGSLMMTVPLACAAVVAVAVSALALLLSSWVLGALVLLGAPALLLLSRLASRPLEARSGVEQQDVAAAAGVATDLVRGLRSIKGLGAEDAATDRYREASERSLAATVRAARAGAGLNGWFRARPGSSSPWSRAPVGCWPATVVGEGGHALTPTQTRQLALARLLLTAPRVAVLDEAAAADVVVMLDGGRVVESGGHDELVSAGGRYARLWRAWSGEASPAAPHAV